MTTPVIEIGDSASHSGGSAIVGPWSIGQDLASLIANSSSAITASGAKIIKLDAGSLSLCSTLQVGNEKDGVVCTKEMVAANQTLLNQLGAYCRANGISVRIEAALSASPNWNYLWLPEVVQAGIPVDGVENDDEIAWTGKGNATTYAAAAKA